MSVKLPEHATLTRSTALKHEEELKRSKGDLHLLGDVIETLKGDLSKLKARNLKLTDRQRKTDNWAFDLERRAVKAEQVLNTVHKVFKSTNNNNLSAQLQSTKRILEKLMAVTERESKKGAVIKSQLAASKSSEGLNRINELEAENAGHKRKINKLFKALATALKQMKEMKPKRTEDERIAEMLKGNFDFDDDDDDVEQNVALEAIEAVKRTSYESSIKTVRCDHCGSNYLVDGGSAKNNGIEAIIKQGGDGFLKTKQDLQLAKAQLRAFKLNIKHLRKENGRFRSAIEYLKAKLQTNDMDVSADFGEVLGGAGIGLATADTTGIGFGARVDTEADSRLHIEVDEPGDIRIAGASTHSALGSPRGVGGSPRRPFYPTSSSLLSALNTEEESFLYVPYDVHAAPGSPGSVPAPQSRSPPRYSQSFSQSVAGGYGLPLSENERFYQEELSRSTTSPTAAYLLSLDNPDHKPAPRYFATDSGINITGAGVGSWSMSGPSGEEKREISPPTAGERGSGSVTYTPGTNKEFDLMSAILASEAKLDRLHTMYKTI